MVKKLFVRSAVITSVAFMSFQTLAAQDIATRLDKLKKELPFWSLNGNSNAILSNKIGTTNNVSLRFVTNNTERMKIHRSGNVGIGTPSPTQKLHVVGKGLFTSGLTISNGGIDVTNTAGYGIVSKGSLGGVFGESPADPELFQAFGPGIGVTGKGSTGIQGAGGIGVYGESPEDPYFEGSPIGLGYGVYGVGTIRGVSGQGTGRSGTGVVGSGAGGVGGIGEEVGVFGTSTGGDLGYGVWGEGPVIGVLGESTDGDGVVGKSTNGYAGAFYGKVFSSGSFETSDQNLKKNVQEFTDAISIIKQLKPKRYEFKEEAQYATLRLPKGNQYGLLAQELQEVLPNLVSESVHQLNNISPQSLRQSLEHGKAQTSNASQEQVKKETIPIKAVHYTGLIPILVKAMQEQQQQIEQLRNKAEKVDRLENEVAVLKQMIIDLKNGYSNGNHLSAAYLDQNAPNPVSSSTIIQYHIPSNVTNAQIVITDMKGAVIKSIALKSNGRGQITLNSGTLAAGTYNYSLWIDYQQVDSKQLIVTR